ncbi:MAG: CpsD/CapB family tyrosine-protein kinase [bacterium]
MLGKYREESPEATEIGRILSKLKAAREERNVKTVMITSSTLAEGKSTTAAYLAIACSKYRNTRTLLIDLDLRRPKIHDLFGLKKKGGIGDILSQKIPTNFCIKSTQYANLKIVTCGKLRDIPSRLLNSDFLKEMLAELRFYFDLVIIDTPPVIPVSDPLMLSSEIDGCLFVIKAGKTQKPVIQRAIKLLRDAKVEILGVILNNVKHVLPYYYDYKFYRYEYYVENESS